MISSTNIDYYARCPTAPWWPPARRRARWSGRRGTSRPAPGLSSEGGMIRLETLIQLKFMNSSFSSSNL